MEHLKGMISERYRVSGMLKQGGMGNLYSALDERLNVNCVLKELVVNSEGEREYMEKAFAREAKILAKIRHAAIPRVTDLFKWQDRWCLVIDYIDGIDLHKLQSQRELSEAEVIDWSLAVLEALEYLHGQDDPIIHRDIKPSNIMLTEKGIVLVDFGIARMVSGSQILTTTYHTQIGSVGFAAPEQYGGQAKSQSDIYGLGVTMHYLLTGKDLGVFGNKGLALNGETDPDLKRIITCATQSYVSDRYQTAGDMKSDLEQLRMKMSGETKLVKFIAPPNRKSWWNDVVGIRKILWGQLKYWGPKAIDWFREKAQWLLDVMTKAAFIASSGLVFIIVLMLTTWILNGGWSDINRQCKMVMLGVIFGNFISCEVRVFLEKLLKPYLGNEEKYQILNWHSFELLILGLLIWFFWP